MKTFNSIFLMLALLFISCNKSEEDNWGEEKQKSVNADYAVLLSKDDNINTQLLNASSDVFALNASKSSLGSNLSPQLISIQGSNVFQYHKDGNCGGKIVKHDFSTDIMEETKLFEDKTNCSITTKAITFSGNSLFVAYTIEVDAMSVEYKVRVVDFSSSEFNFVDITLDKQPESLTIANNQLFVLTLDTAVSEENFLTVIDLSSNKVIYEKKIGLNARQVFSPKNTDVIISYDKLHTKMNSANFSKTYINYKPGTEPKFVTNSTFQFDLAGKMYYLFDSDDISSYPQVPAVYDFESNMLTIYAFENFISEEKRNFELEIENTTAINYDSANNLLLIGYKKIGKQKGGILRIKPTPEPNFIDNIDLDGVPYAIILN